MPARVDKRDLRAFLAHELGDLIEDHPDYKTMMGEADLRHIVRDVIARFVGNSWRVNTEASVPGTPLRADAVITKLTRHGEPDPRHGVIAVEIKANALIAGLKQDIRKLARYCGSDKSEINFGVLVFIGRSDEVEEELRKMSAFRERKMLLVRVRRRR